MCQIKCRIGENLCHGGDQPKKDIYITCGCCFLVIFPRHLDPIWPSMLREKKGGRRCSANSLGHHDGGSGSATLSGLAPQGSDLQDFFSCGF